jgi:hypothetical protein
MIEARKYLRKQFPVTAVEITPANMAEAARWCKGEVRDGGRYIKVKVNNPVNTRQTQAFPGDFLVLADHGGFKIYPPHAFNNTFDLKDDTVYEVEVPEKPTVRGNRDRVTGEPATVFTPPEDLEPEPKKRPVPGPPPNRAAQQQVPSVSDPNLEKKNEAAEEAAKAGTDADLVTAEDKPVVS